MSTQISRQIKRVDARSNAQKEASAINQLSQFCSKMDASFPLYDVKEWKKTSKNPSIMAALVSEAKTIMEREVGCLLVVKQSKVDRDGIGVFVTANVSEEKLVGLYPGELSLIRVS